MLTRSIPFSKGWTVEVGTSWGTFVDIDVHNTGSSKPPIGDASPREALALARALTIAAWGVRAVGALEWITTVTHRLPRTRIRYVRKAGLDPDAREWAVTVGEHVHGRYPTARRATAGALRTAFATYSFTAVWR